jgi:hypothetical protein
VWYNAQRGANHPTEASQGDWEKAGKGLPAERTERAKLTAEESLKRLQEFAKRKGHFVTAVRKDKDRGVSA